MGLFDGTVRKFADDLCTEIQAEVDNQLELAKTATDPGAIGTVTMYRTCAYVLACMGAIIKRIASR